MSQFPKDGEGLPNYDAVNTVGIDPAFIVEANRIATELSELLKVHTDKLVQTKVDLEKLKSLLGIAEQVTTAVEPILSMIANRYQGTQISDLVKGPLANLLNRPDVQKLGQVALTKILAEIETRLNPGSA